MTWPCFTAKLLGWASMRIICGTNLTFCANYLNVSPNSHALKLFSPRLPPMRKLLEWILLFIQTVWHDVTSDFLTANKVENYATSLILNPLPLDEVDILPPSRKDNTLSPDSLSTLPFLRKLIHLLDAEISPTILSERCITIIQNQQAVALTLVVCLEPSTS